jgi:formylglycine-generating enzyme required for sulfatase activity
VADATVINTAGYSGSVTWSPALEAGGVFGADKTYTATMTLSTKSGYTFAGVSANSFGVAGATSVSAVVNSDSEVVVTAVFPKTGVTVTQLALGGLTAPVAGATAVGNVTVTSDYASGQVSWSPALNGGKFNADTVYTATVTLVATSGKTVYGVGTNAYTWSGATSVSHVAHSGVVVAVFPKTDATVTALALGGLTAPVTGETAATSVTETAQYTGSVTWSPALVDGKFTSGTGYVATVTLTAKSGYTLTGVGANTFTATGGVATHGANSGVVTVSYGVVMVPASLITSLPIGSGNTITNVTIPNFNIGTTEVVGALWSEVRTWALANGYTAINAGSNGGSTTLPIASVSWYDVVVWLNAYSERTGLTPVYRDTSGNVLKDASATSTLNSAVQSNNNGYRLPTANEGEMAARWLGTTVPTVGSLASQFIATSNNGVGYYWTPGNYASGATEDVNNPTETQAVGWYSANSGGAAKAVGGKRANALGMFDVSGNVWEWQFTSTGGTNRGIRGGGWVDDSSYMAVSIVFSIAPSYIGTSLGFRLARTSL